MSGGYCLAAAARQFSPFIYLRQVQEDEEVLMKSRNPRRKKSLNTHTSAAILAGSSFACQIRSGLERALIHVLIPLPAGRIMVSFFLAMGSLP